MKPSASSSSKAAGAPASKTPFARELIEKEIAHLKKRGSVRQAQETQRAWGKTLVGGAAFLLLALYFMDPVLFSYHRGEAIRAYLYLHNYGNDAQAAALADCGLLKPVEVRELNHRIGSFQDYFNGTQAAEQKALALIAYMNGVRALHDNRYDELTPSNKLRYILFIKTGLTPPIRWDVLNSSVDK